tara:strand:- start:1108 stop:1446 length:339 start_codon:yes stop_codon:yes gene_type:complete
MGFNMVDHGAWIGSIRHPLLDDPRAQAIHPSNHQDKCCYLKSRNQPNDMADLSALLMALIWPGVLLISVLVISRTMLVVARSGIRVEIFTREPILISTGRAPLRAEVGKVRI